MADNQKRNRALAAKRTSGPSSRLIDSKLKLIVKGYPNSLKPIVEKDLKLLSASGLNSFGSLVRAVQSKDLDKKTRALSCWALGQLRDKRAVRALMVAFGDSSRDVRWEAAKALHIIEGKTAIRPLIVALHEGKPDQRAAAAYALGALRDRRAVGALLVRLRDTSEHSRVRALAAEGLAHIGDTEVVPDLITALSDSSPEVRFWSAFALGELRATEAVPELERVADSDNAIVRSWGTVQGEASRALQNIQANQM